MTGLVYDRTGSYAPAFWLAIGCSAVSVVAMWLAAPRKVRLVAGRVPRRPRREEPLMTDAATLLARTRARSSRASRRCWTVSSPGSPPARWRARPAPDEWAPVEIVCHLRDEEAEDFGARVRVVLDGGGAFAPIDPEGWATARRYRDADPAAALGRLPRSTGRASLAILAGATPERLAASGESPSGLRLSGLDLLAAWVAHDGLHLRQLAGTLTREWADRWAPLRVDYAGPIPYPSGDGGSTRSGPALGRLGELARLAA